MEGGGGGLWRMMTHAKLRQCGVIQTTNPKIHKIGLDASAETRAPKLQKQEHP